MLPNLTHLNLTRITATEVEERDRAAPTCRATKLYRIVACPHCDAEIRVSVANFYTQLDRRMSAHLGTCSGNMYGTTASRRARVNEGRKPLGRATVPQTQLYIDANGRLARHELGSLLRCVVPSKRAVDGAPLRPPLRASRGDESYARERGLALS
tara:strand:+ start:988 stop:1452 length:465 start_codon:yes stop_codon:yes gene_type:complete